MKEDSFRREIGKLGLNYVELKFLMLISISKKTIYLLKSSFVFQGALVGLMCGFIVSLWVGIGSQLYPPLPERTMPLHLETRGCNSTYNGTDLMATTEMPFSTSAFQVHNVERY